MVKVRERAKKRLLLVNDRGYPLGETHHRARHSDADVDLVLELRAAGLSYAKIAAKLDDVEPPVSKSWVRDVCKGLIRAQLPVGTKKV